MPPQHERETVSREVFDYFATQATKMLDGHEKDSLDHEKRIIVLETQSAFDKSRWGFLGGTLSVVVIEGIKLILHK